MDELENEIQYCKDLIEVIKKVDIIAAYPKVKEKMNLLEETLEDDIEHMQFPEDEDAKVGNKTHIAMTEERIITAVTVTTGEKMTAKN